jgi:hypothetical protein
LKRRSLSERQGSSFLAHQRSSCACGITFRDKSNLPKSNSPFLSELENVLHNTKARRYFHLFASNEHSVENILFWTEAKVKYLNAKESERKIIAKNIIETFFDSDSLLELNVTALSKRSIIRRFEEEGPVEDLFAEMVLDIESGGLMDTFGRFKESDLGRQCFRKIKL